MCSPSLAIVGLNLLGAGMSARAQRKAGEANEATAKAQAELAEFNADDALARGKIDEQLYRQDVARLKGSQRASIGASGFDTSGDLQELLAQTAAMGEFGALTIRTNAKREAYGYRLEGKAMTAQARYARKAGNTGAASTLLTGAAQSYGIYKDLS